MFWLRFSWMKCKTNNKYGAYPQAIYFRRNIRKANTQNSIVIFLTSVFKVLNDEWISSVKKTTLKSTKNTVKIFVINLQTRASRKYFSIKTRFPSWLQVNGYSSQGTAFSSLFIIANYMLNNDNKKIAINNQIMLWPFLANVLHFSQFALKWFITIFMKFVACLYQI